jgi:hypothetical protein
MATLPTAVCNELFQPTPVPRGQTTEWLMLYNGSYLKAAASAAVGVSVLAVVV